MKRDYDPEEEPQLFDLPLEPELPLRSEFEKVDPVIERPPEEPEAPRMPEALELFPEEEEAGETPEAQEGGFDTGPMPALGQRHPAPLSLRLSAGLLDLGVIVALAAAVLAGLLLMHVELATDLWPALVLFELTFSFVYCVVPLGFWGKTPGMKRFGLLARNHDGKLLSFGQTTLRWLGGLLTLVGLGLPLLLLPLTGTSLADLLSASMTYEVNR